MTDALEVPWKPKFNPWLIALTVTLATFMEVLDTSIANVSLPHIAGSLSASHEESAWVLTSYLVSNAIILPISAWLSTIIGRKRFYMMCVTLFTISSFLCGLAPSLGMLIFFRVLQGVGGDPVVGIGQCKEIFDKFPGTTSTGTTSTGALTISGATSLLLTNGAAKYTARAVG